MAKKKEIMLTRENSLILPRILTEVGMTPSVIGNRLSVAFVKRLQDAFKQIITDHRTRGGWQLGLFDTPDIREKYLRKGSIEFPLHMSELVQSKTNYQMAFDFVCKADLVKVIVPDYDDDHVLQGFKADLLYKPIIPPNAQVLLRTKDDESEMTMNYDEYFKTSAEFKKGVTVIKYTYQKGTTPVIKIAIPQDVAEHIYNMRANKYGHILDVLSVSSNNKYFSPIYNWIAVHQKEGIVEVEYESWKENILGLIPDKDGNKPTMKGYEKFAQFNKAVLAPCLKELKDKGEEGTDCWAEVEKIYLNGRAPNPDKLRFIIHVTELGKRLQEEKEATRQMMEIEKRLREEFDQNDIQVYAISKNTPVDHRSKLVAKMNELAAKKKSGKIKVEQSWQQYCNVVFSHLLADIKKGDYHEEAIEPIKEEPQSNVEEVVEVVKTETLSKEEVVMWETVCNKICERVGEKVFSTYFAFLSIRGCKNGTLHLHAPSKYVVEVVEGEYLQEFAESIKEVYPHNIKIAYSIG